MKWSNFRNFKAYKKDLKVLREDELKNYYEHVIQIANTFPRDQIAIGILDITDLIQAGNAGLIDAWSNVDWDLIDESPNPNGQLWSFLKKRIKFAIRREIDNCGAFIKIPRRQLESHRKNLTGIDRILVDTFPQFFDNAIIYEEEYGSWENVQLSEVLDDMIYNSIHNHDHQQILKLTFGIDTHDNKPVSMKKIAEMYKTSVSYIQNIKFKCLKQLKTDENEGIVKDFYENV